MYITCNNHPESLLAALGSHVRQKHPVGWCLSRRQKLFEPSLRTFESLARAHTQAHVWPVTRNPGPQIESLPLYWYSTVSLRGFSRCRTSSMDYLKDWTCPAARFTVLHTSRGSRWSRLTHSQFPHAAVHVGQENPRSAPRLRAVSHSFHRYSSKNCACQCGSALFLVDTVDQRGRLEPKILAFAFAIILLGVIQLDDTY